MSALPPVTVPYIDLTAQHRALLPELLAACESVLTGGQFVLGPQVREFEEKFAELCGTRYAVGVDNGTSALFLAMRALGIGPGDEVITAPNSFLASASSIVLVGATPVFCDVRDDFNMDPAQLEKCITPRTKAVIPVHLTGRPADMDAILSVAKRHDLHVIEDAAQAVGARYNDKAVGSFGSFGCFSLHPLKNLSAVGDGGMITTNDEGFYKALLLARNHGLRDRDHCATWSYNCRLDTLQAAMLLVKLPHLAAWNEARRTHAAFYQKYLSDVVTVPVDTAAEESVYHTFIIQTDKRDALKAHLRAQGIETAIHYPIAIHLQEAAASLGYKRGDFPVTERQADQILSLPVYPNLSVEQRAAVVASIRSFFGA